MTLLNLRGIKKSFGELNVFKNIDLDINSGEIIGIVGKNGAGKTTLANIIFGNLIPDKGSITRYKQNIKIGYLYQSTEYNENNFKNMVNDYNNRGTINNFLECTSHLGLNKVNEWDTERFNKLSGGEKTKLALANVWLSNPDILILDEPTNNLDFTGIEWLISELKRFNDTQIIISHDRYFLDQITTKIIEIADGKINNYAGNYTFYREEKERRYNSQMHQYNVQKKYREKIEEEINKLENWSAQAHRESREKTRTKGGFKEFYRKKAKKMDRKIKSRIKSLRKIEVEGVEKPKSEPKLHFTFNNSEKRGKRILEAKEITKGYNKYTLFKNSSFYIQRNEKIGLIGSNGCGKTTLIKIIIGEEELDKGDIWLSKSLKLAYLSQDVMDLDIERKALEILNIDKDPLKKGEALTLLANMGINKEAVTKPVKYLSLGERTKIKIAKLIINKHDFLILDEPTNHLDLSSREQLEDTLTNFAGTILIVSHDRYMLEKICNKLLVIENSQIKRLEHGFNDYEIKEVESLKQQNNQSMEEEKMVIENRISFLLGKLSSLNPNDNDYHSLDQEFKELVKKKNNLKFN